MPTEQIDIPGSLRTSGNAALVAVLILLGSECIAGAQGSGSAGQQAACTPDVFRLCAGDVPDERAILVCLNRNVAQLSPDCRRVIDPRPHHHPKSRLSRQIEPVNPARPSAKPATNA